METTAVSTAAHAPKALGSRAAPFLVAGLIVLALAAPVTLLGSFVRETISSDIAVRSGAERQRSASLAAALVAERLASAAGGLELLATRTLLQDALRRRDQAALARHLSDLRSVHPDYISAGVFDRTGLLLTRDPHDPSVVGRDFSSRDYFSGGIAATQPYLSEAYVSQAAGNPVLVALAMAVREQDEVLGLAQLTLSPQQVLSWLRSLQPGPGRELLIVDRQAQVIASTDPARPILAPMALPGLALALAGESGEASFRVGGAERLITYAHVPRGAWALFVIDDPAIVLAPERALHATIGAATLGAAIAATLMGVVLGIFVLALRRQRAELAEASRYKSEFLARMSHELRTPMNAILGFSELLGERPAEVLTDRQKRYVRNIRDAGDQLVEIINNVLDLAKVEAGRVELQIGVIALGQLLEPVVAGTRRAAAEAGVRFDVVAQDAAVRLDASRMRQVLYNLLSNAVKFTPREGRVMLSAGLDGSELFVDVSDTGLGIPADKHDRVFGTFERLHRGKSHAQGTGLGLALTKELVELHGGTISFESEEGHGTIFHVRLAGAAAQLVAGRRILVVEDESGDADLIVELAAAAGLRCEVVGSARSALLAAQRNPPLAVVLDLRLPDERGERVLAALKASPATNSIPVLVVSVDEDDGGARRLGADDYLTKPIDRARLGAWLIRAAATDPEYAPAGA